MKGLILALALGSPAHADAADETCRAMAQAASAMMRARQEGVPADKLMAPVDAMEPAQRRQWRALVLEALDRPRYQTAQMQERETTEFGNKVYLACMRNA